MHTQLAQQNQQIETLTDELQSYIERVQLVWFSSYRFEMLAVL